MISCVGYCSSSSGLSPVLEPPWRFRRAVRGEDLGREVPPHLQLAVVWNGQFLSWDIYIQCSRIELKMSNKSRQLQQHIIFCYAVGLCGWVSV